MRTGGVNKIIYHRLTTSELTTALQLKKLSYVNLFHEVHLFTIYLILLRQQVSSN